MTCYLYFTILVEVSSIVIISKKVLSTIPEDHPFFKIDQNITCYCAENNKLKRRDK